MAAAAATSKDRCRSPPLSLSDFQQLVTTAFDLHADSSCQQHPSLAFRRIPTPVPRASSSLSVVYPTPDDTLSADLNTTSLDTNADDDQLSNLPRARPSISQSHLPFGGLSDRPRTTLSLFKVFKSRASALLRPSVSDPDATVTPVSIDSISRPSTARPSVSSQRTLQPLAGNSLASPLRLRSSDSASPLCPSTQHSNTALPRVRTRSLPKSFLKMSPHGIHPPPPVPLASLDSYLDVSSLKRGRDLPSYACPPARPQIQIHTQLPPLRKSRSFAPSIFNKPKRSSSKLSDRPAISRTKSSYGLRSSRNIQDAAVDHLRCPSPFTNPRNPPPLPRSGELEVPDYVFQRRGSATSSCTLVSNHLHYYPQSYCPCKRASIYNLLRRFPSLISTLSLVKYQDHLHIFRPCVKRVLRTYILSFYFQIPISLRVTSLYTIANPVLSIFNIHRYDVASRHPALADFFIP